MLYAQIGDKTLIWHTGKTFPFTKVDVRQSHSLHMEVQADCDELIYIRSRFPNIRQFNTDGVVTWVGEDAKFIMMNLSSGKE